MIIDDYIIAAQNGDLRRLKVLVGEWKAVGSFDVNAKNEVNLCRMLEIKL